MKPKRPRALPPRPALTWCAGLALLALLAGCASPEPSSRFTGAAATPLHDLNIVNAPIPEVLLQAQRAPYALPEDRSCGVLATQVRVLTEVLGADLDAPASASNPSLVERGGTLAENEAVSAVQRTAEGVIPFRGWIRKLTGAERYSRQVAAAIAAGTARRAFLKGLGAGQGCA